MDSVKPNQKIPSDILDDLASRFIINIPVEERSDFIRLCFQIELAHWFYIDFICKNKSDIIGCGNKVFALQLFQHIPFLREHVPKIDNIFDEWRQYKLSVPTYGAIILSEDLQDVLLVQSFWAKSSWGFPKGKINENEPPVNCAIREVLEETGFNIGDLIDPNEYIESIVSDQFTRLYIVTNVPRSTQFCPQTRNEIKSCEWFPVEYLPVTRYDTTSKANLGMNSNAFFMITPFVKRLKKWINDRRQGKNTTSVPARQRHHSTGDLETLKRGTTTKNSGSNRGSGRTNNNTNSNGTKSTSKIPNNTNNQNNTANSNNSNSNMSNQGNSTGRNSTGTSSAVFTNSKINQILYTSTPEQKVIKILKSDGTQRKLFKNENEKENNLKNKLSKEKNLKKAILQFPSENSLSKWTNFKFDRNQIFTPRDEKISFH